MSTFVEVDTMVFRIPASSKMTSPPAYAFCGSLYHDKKLDFLVDACDRIHQQSPEFHCVVLGDGPSMPTLHEAAATRP